jgi:hypothetical protein
MSDWELGMYHGWGVSQQHAMDGMRSVVLVDGKHHKEFRGETAEMDANRHAMDLANKRRLLANNIDVTSTGHEQFRDIQHEGMWYRQHAGDAFHSPMGN